MKKTTFVLLLAFISIISNGQVNYEVITKTGETAPGTSNSWKLLNPPDIAKNDLMAFVGTPEGIAQGGIWAGTTDNFQKLFQTGDPAPGTSGTFSTISWSTSHVEIANNGEIFFMEDVGDEYGIWAGHYTDPQLMIYTEFKAPGTDGYFSSISDIQMNDTGTVVINGRLKFTGSVDATNYKGIWIGKPGNVELLARMGDQAPGEASGNNFNSFILRDVNIHNQVAFRSTLSSTGEGCILFGGKDNLQLIAKANQEPPGITGAKFNSLEEIRINDKGDVAFHARLAIEGDVTQDNNGGIWLGTPGNFDLVVRKGDNVPGKTGVKFGSLDNLLMNEKGNLVFTAILTGTNINDNNNSAVFLYKENTLTMMVQKGDDALSSNGVVLGSITNLYFNNNDDIAFSATVTGTDVTLSNDEGTWATGNGTLYLIGREGDSFELAEGDTRDIYSTDFSSTLNYAEGNRSPYNDKGELFMKFKMTNPSSEALMKITLPTGTLPSNDTKLSSLSVDGGHALSPSFSSGITTYAVELPTGTTDVPELIFETNDPNASTSYNAATNLSGNQKERTSSIMVTAEDGFSTNTYNVVFSVETSTSIDGINKIKTKIFPNPFSSYLKIESFSSLDVINIYNMQGQKVLQLQDIATKIVSMDLSGLESGLYLMQVQGQNGKPDIYKIIKE